MRKAELAIYAMKSMTIALLKALRFIGIALANGIGYIFAMLLIIVLFCVCISLMLFVIPGVLHIGGPMWLAITLQILVYIIAFNIAEHNNW